MNEKDQAKLEGEGAPQGAEASATKNAAKKPKSPVVIKGKISLKEFRDLMERCLGQSHAFTDAHIGFIRRMLQSLEGDTAGVVRISLSPLTSESQKPKTRLTGRRVSTGTMPGEDEVRNATREIALLADEELALSRIEDLPIEFLQRAASLFGIKSETIVGLKAAFAEVVADIRQMENIAAARPPPSAASADPSLAPPPPEANSSQ